MFQRIPSEYAARLGVAESLMIRIMNLDGEVVNLHVRSEKHGNGQRYIVRNWFGFLESNGIDSGDVCTFVVGVNEDTMVLTNIEKA